MIIGDQAEAALENWRSADADGSSRLEQLRLRTSGQVESMRRGRLSQAAVPDLSRMFVEFSRRERATILRMDTREHHRLSDRLIEITEEIKSRGEEGRKALLLLLDLDDENVRL